MAEKKTTDAKKTASKKEETAKTAVKKSSKVTIPSIQQMLDAGAHFGHQTKRWSPKMESKIYDSRNGIHIIDIYKTGESLEKAVNFLSDAASRGEVVIVGTKRQAANIVREAAIEAGAHFVNQRWAGGLLTNFKKVRESFKKLNDLEKAFEEGVQDRTKYEVSVMKRDWGKLDRLYSGIKSLNSKPTAMVVIDAKFEKGAVSEAKNLGIPVVALVDTNTDPNLVQYPIPCNDDAIASIKLMTDTFVEAIKEGNGGKGVKHDLKDYSKEEIEIKKTTDVEAESEEVDTPETEPKKRRVVKAKPKRSSKKSKTNGNKGILEKVQDAKKK